MNSKLETNLLGLILNEPSNLSKVLAQGVTADCFLDEEPRRAFAEIVTLDAQGKRWDLATVAMKLGGNYASYLTGVCNDAPYTLNAEFFAQELVAAHWRYVAHRELGLLAKQIGAGLPLERAKEELSAAVSRLMDGHSSVASWEPVELADKFCEEAEKIIIEAREGRSPGITTGISGLDAMIGGWMPATFNVIGARTSRGKTTLALNFAYYAAVDAKKNVAYFTIEMRATRLLGKLVSRVGAIAGSAIVTGQLSEDEIDRLTGAVKTFAELGIRINDRAGRSIDTVEAEAWRLKRAGKLDLLIVDYVQQLHCYSKKFQSRQAELNEITGRLQALAMKLEIPVIVLAQLNREAEKLPDGEAPNKSHLKDSGSIEQDADVIMLIHRERVDDPKAPTWIIVDKNRDGRLGAVSVAVDFTTNKFSDPRR